MATGLPISDVVTVNVVISPLAAPFRNFGAMMVVGSTAGVIDLSEGQRAYTTFEQVLGDFPVLAPEAVFANLYFSQDPQPSLLYIGRWAQAATAGLLRGGVLTPVQRLISNFTAITAGALTVPIDGAPVAVTGLDFSAQTNLNGVAQVLQTKLAAAKAGVTVLWDANSSRFTISSGTTGVASTLGYATTPANGTNTSSLFKFGVGAASVPVPGATAEFLIDAVKRLGDGFTNWYGLSVATATPPAIADHIAVAAYIEAANTRRIYGVTITDTGVLDPTNTADLGSVLQGLGYQRTFTQYSSSSPYAVASMFARAFTVDFSASNSTITLKFKQEPGVTAEFLTETQAQTLRAKNVNVFVAYNNSTAIIQEGVMANGYFFDEVHGLDWLQNNVQTRIFNLLYQSQTKVPQTDEGMNQIVNEVNAGCLDGVRNGLIAPGQWNADGFGPLKRGDALKTGFLIYVQPIDTQAQTDREKRVTPPIQGAIKLAGAVHFANVRLNVNR